MKDFIQNTGDWIAFGAAIAVFALMGIMALMPEPKGETRRYPNTKAVLDARGRIVTGWLIIAVSLIPTSAAASIWWYPGPLWLLRAAALAFTAGSLLGWGFYRTVTGWLRLRKLRRRRPLLGPVALSGAAVCLAATMCGLGFLITLYRVAKVGGGKQ